MDDQNQIEDESEDFSMEGQSNIMDTDSKKLKSKRKTGVVYIQTVPPLFTVTRMREVLSSFGEIGRIYLQAERHTGKSGRRHKKYTEGWVEFKSKRVAKYVAETINGSPVGGRKRSAAYDTLWTIKYLKGFKWVHLMEQLDYERRIDDQRKKTEMSQAKRVAEHFAHQVEKGEKLKKLEEKVLKKGGLWERYQLQIQQRSVFDEAKKQKSKSINESDSFLRMIFDAGNDEKNE